MNIIHIFRNLKYGGCQTLSLSIIKSPNVQCKHHIIYLNEESCDTASMKKEFLDSCESIHYIDQCKYSLTEVSFFIQEIVNSLSDVKIVSWFYPFSLKLNIEQPIYHHAGMAALPIFDIQWLKNNLVHLLFCNRRKNDVVIYASDHIKNTHNRKYIINPIHSLVVYNGVDLDRFRFVHRDRPIKKFIMVGRLDGSKDFDSFIELAKAIKSSYHDIEFSIAGDGEDRARLEKLNVAFENPVRFLGMVSNIPDVLVDYDCLVFLNKVVEGFGNVIVESMLSGLVVVTNNLGASKEIIEHEKSGFLVDSTFHLNQVISNLICGHYNVSKLTNSARDRAENLFSNERCAKSYLSILSGQNENCSFK
ncbi:glycosyltransferase family 4 protein [Vibrio parahaemolyticus]|nr:glycosyltransferase family 4 protein [Vibrio parahaemolyticus]EGR0909898.1 glycosyltransferase [Vibrio parahaemolyticus]EGR1593918.1 glycosyltransferase [Vibrio parahaemolyticus]EGR1724807.1 glycosyltransferase [Vibrio parahaemolyticus]EGR5926208.1 glycosyltransferase family 4 protein [Vibrio parahaemolyticus]